eukprot:CAMPEP_0116008170 /NCGR_PEP_ID=MMETSP0321-20121206/2712_1 /TAXON_ID=163516 /ORGANISM="Leptocylindrus danicus var. danicus, Strain B650" /LENGTH=51 /DNA_ID=CAMNT_0003476959 /DNA_START=166 /DNA_END=318 /DNA_ORIENTATION=+
MGVDRKKISLLLGFGKANVTAASHEGELIEHRRTWVIQTGRIAILTAIPAW